MQEDALKSFPLWVKRTLAYLFRGRPPYPMVASGLFSQLRDRGIPVWWVNLFHRCALCSGHAFTTRKCQIDVVIGLQLMEVSLAVLGPYRMLHHFDTQFYHLLHRFLRFLGVNTESDLLLAASSGATAVLTDRVNWAVPFIKTNKLKFRKIKTWITINKIHQLQTVTHNSDVHWIIFCRSVLFLFLLLCVQRN